MWAFAHVKNDEGGWMIARYAIPSKIGYMYDETPLGEYPIELMLNAVAYLCSVNADINVEYRPPKISKPNPKKDKKRSFATWHSVGSHIGAQLREYERYKSEHNGEGVGSVRPHMRRAHFHHYWVGSKYARRLELRWLSPIKVGFGGIESTTLHRVQ